MRLLTVGENEAGQRLDKLLGKYMDKAPTSFCLLYTSRCV